MLEKLLSTPTAQLGKASRFVVFQIKLWSHCARLLRRNRSGQQAAALSYHTIFGLVPLAIVTLLIFQSLPAYSNIGQKVRELVYQQLHLTTIEYSAGSVEAEEKIIITDHLDNIVSKFFTGINKGSITLISVAVVIWAALALLSTIERAFNNIWHVTLGRNFLQRIINYWALLTLGPLLLGLGIYITTRYATFGKLQKTILAHTAPVILSYIVAVVAFFLLYFVLPNTKVKAKAAIWGAAVAAVVWIAAKNLFGFYVTEYRPYGTVYGMMALIPVTVLWIYITWLIVLFGLQLTFTTQHLKNLDAAEIAASAKTEDYFIANDLTAINIVREIAAAFEANKAPVEAQIVSSKLNIPAQFSEKILNHLVARGILIKSAEPRVGFVPAQDPANIRLSDISEAVAAVGFAQSTADQPGSLRQIAQSHRNILAQYNLKQVLSNEQNTDA